MPDRHQLDQAGTPGARQPHSPTHGAQTPGATASAASASLYVGWRPIAGVGVARYIGSSVRW